jgi:hypothetical protein
MSDDERDFDEERYNDHPILVERQWITRYADNDLLITVFEDASIAVAPRLDPTRWDKPLMVREVP